MKKVLTSMIVMAMFATVAPAFAEGETPSVTDESAAALTTKNYVDTGLNMFIVLLMLHKLLLMMLQLLLRMQLVPLLMLQPLLQLHKLLQMLHKRMLIHYQELLTL